MSIINAMVPNTRLRIINYLKINDLGTADEISKALSMTRANIQYHLQIMLEENIIEMVSSNHSARGRPSNQYCLTVHLYENNYQNLCRSFLLHISKLPSQSDYELACRSIAEFMFPDLSPVSQDIVTHLNHSIQLLNRHKYHARWEAHKDGPRVIFNNCPFLSLLPDIPDLCKFDIEIMKHVFKCPVRLIKYIKIDTQPPGYCVLSLGN